jgi:hypothetical protein
LIILSTGTFKKMKDISFWFLKARQKKNKLTRLRVSLFSH